MEMKDRKIIRKRNLSRKRKLSRNKRVSRRKNLKRIKIIVITILLILGLGRLVGNFNKSDLKEDKNYGTKNTLSHNTKNTLSNSNENTLSHNTENTLHKEQVLLVNRTNPIGVGYRPSNLVNVNTDGSQNVFMEEEAAIKFQEMVNDAKKDGVNIIPISAYRSYEYQKNVFDQSAKNNGLEHAKKYVAIPGESEHQTGLAIDVGTPGAMDVTEKFEKTAAYKWLNQNMDKYGFILRYPKEKENITGYKYEPWHLRYVGSEVAKDIKNKNLTLEQYLNR